MPPIQPSQPGAGGQDQVPQRPTGDFGVPTQPVSPQITGQVPTDGVLELRPRPAANQAPTSPSTPPAQAYPPAAQTQAAGQPYTQAGQTYTGGVLSQPAGGYTPQQSVQNGFAPSQAGQLPQPESQPNQQPLQQPSYQPTAYPMTAPAAPAASPQLPQQPLAPPASQQSPGPQQVVPAPNEPVSDPNDPNKKYEFILNPEKKPHKSSLLPAGATAPGMNMTKVLLLAGGVMILLIVLAVVLSMARGGDKPATGLYAILNDQQEIIHVTSKAGNNLESGNLQTFTATANSTTTSSQQELIAFLSQHKVKINADKLAATPFTSADQTLSAAQAANTYDAAYKQLMADILKDYQSKILQTGKTSTGSERTILQKELAAAELLSKQLEQQ